MSTDPLAYVLSCMRRAADNAYPWSLTPTEAGALVAEVERLRGEVSYLRACVPPTRPTDYGHEVWTAALRAEVAAERAAVVAWLDAQLPDIDFCEGCGQRGTTVDRIADCIERGEHRREEDKG
jgi:hypothetical protein